MTVNLRNNYEFDSRGYGDPRNGGGLAALLQQAIEQQRLRQQGDGSWLLNAGTWPYASNAKGLQYPFPTSGGSLDDRAPTNVTAPYGMLGDPMDPNFRQLSRLEISRGPDGANTPDHQSESIPSPRSEYPNAENLASAAGETSAGTTAPPRYAMLATGPDGRPLPYGQPLPWKDGGGGRSFGGSTSGGPGISLPKIEWWEIARKILQMFPMSPAGSGGDNFDPKFETYRRCKRAAERGEQAWNDFCDDLPVDDRAARAACYSKTYESPQNKSNWCRNQFGID